MMTHHDAKLFVPTPIRLLLLILLLDIHIHYSIGTIVTTSITTTVPTPTPTPTILSSSSNLPTSIRSDNGNTCNTDSDTYNHLTCWLWGLVLPLPDTDIQEGVTIQLRDMECTHFALKDIHTHTGSDDVMVHLLQLLTSVRQNNTTSSNNENENEDWLLDLNGIQSECRGKYHIPSLLLTGHVRGSTTDDSNMTLHLTATFANDNNDNNENDNNNITTLEYLNTTHIDSNIWINEHTLHFSGYVTAAVLNSFKHSIAKYMSHAMNAFISSDDADGDVMDDSVSVAGYMTNYTNTVLLARMQSYIRDITDTTSNSNVVHQYTYEELTEVPYTRNDWRSSILMDRMEPYDRIIWQSLGTINQQYLGGGSSYGGLVRSVLSGVLRAILHVDSASASASASVNEVWTWTTILPEEDILLYSDVNNNNNINNNSNTTITLSMNAMTLQLIPDQLHILSSLDDSLQMFNPLALYPNTFRTGVRLSDGTEVRYAVNCTVTVRTTSTSNTTSDSSDVNVNTYTTNTTLTEYTQVSGSIKGMSMYTDVYIGMNEQHLEGMTLREVLSLPSSSSQFYDDTDGKYLCVLRQAVDVIHVTNLTMGVSDMEYLTIHHTKTKSDDTKNNNNGLEEALDEVLNGVLERYLNHTTAHTGLNVILQGIAQGPVRTTMNTFWNHLILSQENNISEYDDNKCPTNNSHTHTNGTATSYLPWTQSTVLHTLQTHVFTSQSWNKLVQYGTMYINKYLLQGKEYTYTNPQLADLSMVLGNTTLKLGHSSDGSNGIDFFVPDGTTNDNDGRGWYHGWSSIALQELSLDMDVTLQYNLQQDDNDVYEKYHIHTQLKDLSTSAGLYALYDTWLLLRTSLHDILHVPVCSIAPFHALQWYNSSFGTTDVVVRILRDMDHDDDDMTNNNGTREVLYLHKKEVTDAVSDGMSEVLTFLQSMFNRHVNALLRVSEVLCPAAAAADINYTTMSSSSDSSTTSTTTSDDDDGVNVGLLLGILLPILLVMGASSAAYYYRYCYNINIDNDNDNNIIHNAALSSQLQEPLLVPTATTTTTSIKYNHQPSLLRSQTLPGMVRYLILTLIMTTITLFAVSNSNIGATVDLSLTTHSGDDEYTYNLEDAIYEFSLVSILHDMYHAGTYALLFLIFVMSVLVPYVKLATMFVAWCVPPRYMHPNTRDRVLLVLEAIGKYALVDVFVLVIMVVSFRYHLELGLTSSRGLDVDVYVNPQSGFYCFLTATIMSIVLGHVVLFCHRYVAATHTVPSSSEAKVLLTEHEFQVKDQKKVKLSSKALMMMEGMLLLTSALISLGIFTKSFEFEFYGLAGLPLEDPDRSLSLLSIGYEIPTSVQNQRSFGSLFIQACYYFFALIMPVLFLVLTFVMLRVPLQAKTQMWCLTLIEIASAWSALEVFMISMVASLAEISDIASYIIGDVCDDINKFLEESKFFDTVLDGHDTCFDVEAHLHASSTVLFVGTILNFILMFYMVRIIHQAVDERVHREGTKIVDIDCSSTTVNNDDCESDDSDTRIEALQHVSGEGSIDDHVGMIQVLHSYSCLSWMFVEVNGPSDCQQQQQHPGISATEEDHPLLQTFNHNKENCQLKNGMPEERMITDPSSTIGSFSDELGVVYTNKSTSSEVATDK